jgi:methyltransferase
MLSDTLGPAQTVALLVLLQRALEELYSKRNARRLLVDGAREEGGHFYPVVAAAHLSWIAGLAFLVPPNAPIQPLPFAIFIALQPLRYRIIATLGHFWTQRIISLPRAPIVKRGPYRLTRHPNYVVAIAETFVLPLAFGQFAFAVIFTTLWIIVLRHKIHKIQLEDAALAKRYMRVEVAL